MDPLIIASAIIGALTLSLLLIRLLALIYHYFIYSFSYKNFKGDWAVVTGASGGIGAGIARSLAKKGINLILIARSTDKLETISEDCKKKHSVDTKVIGYDFGNTDKEEFKKLIDEISPLKPTILINNVGINVEFPTELLDMDQEDIDRMVTINIQATNHMTSALLPNMVDASRGIVICLSSGGGAVTPAPLLSPYAGTKAYNNSFATSLSGEVKQRGIHVHSLTPFFVESAMAKMKSSFSVPSADQFADLTLKLVGSSYPRLQPYWVHYIMESALTSIPLSMQVDYVTNLHRNIRKRALRKKEKMAKAAETAASQE